MPTYTPQQVATINKARSDNSDAGRDPYSGAGATEYSKTRGTTGDTPTKVPRYPSPGVSGSDQTKAAEKSYLDSTKPRSAAEIEADIMSSYSGEISGIQSMYQSMLADQKLKNASAEGRTRAGAAETGVLGGDFGNAEQNTAEQASADANKKIMDEENTKLATIRSGAADTARATAESEKTTYQGGLEKNIGYVQKQAEDTRTKIQTIASSTKLEDLTQQEYDTLYANSGFSNGDEFNAYFNASRTAAQMGTKLVGNATTGFYLPSIGTDGQIQYKNVIKPIVKPTQYGAYQFNPDTGAVETIAPAAPKIVSSGGRLWSIDPKTSKATPLTSKAAGSGVNTKVGWGKATTDQHLAVTAYADNHVDEYNKAHGTSYTPEQIISAAKGNEDAFLTVLNLASEAGIYTPATVTSSDTTDTSATDAATQAATDAADAATNAGLNTDTSGDTGVGQ